MEKLISNLKKRGFEAHFVKSGEEANELISTYIKSGESVGFGGSETVKEIGLVPFLNNRGIKTLHREFSPEVQREDMYTQQHAADWYISSANALTESGEIINIDGRGNRVADTIYGPRNVIFVVGKNKIAASIDTGIERVRNVAAPKNAVRLGRKTPCAITGKCTMCNSPDNLCRATVILHHPTIGQRAVVILIDQVLGY